MAEDTIDPIGFQNRREALRRQSEIDRTKPVVKTRAPPVPRDRPVKVQSAGERSIGLARREVRDVRKQATTISRSQRKIAKNLSRFSKSNSKKAQRAAGGIGAALGVNKENRRFVAQQQALRKQEALRRQQRVQQFANNESGNTNEKEVIESYEELKRQELEAARYNATRMSANTAAMLAHMRRIQNLPKTANANMQRINREKKLIGKAGSLLATPYIFNDYTVDMTGVSTDNILAAQNVFAENPDNNILRPKGKASILDTRSTGNHLLW